jgi:predicted metalloendopeptidase
MSAAMSVRRLALPLLLLACDRPASTPAPAAPPAPAPAAPAPVQRPSLVARDPIGAGVIAAIDTTVDPCVDFYQYACGGWLKKTPLPADKPRYGRGGGELTDRNNQTLRQILERAAAAKGKVSPVDQKLGAFWAACMDEAALDRAGIAPLQPLLAQANAVKDEASLLRTVGKLHANYFAGGGPLLTIYLEPDAKRPTVYVAQLAQGGTGLPDRDFYLKTDPQHRQLLALYQAHVAEMLGFLGEPADRAAAQAAAVVGFETQLAQISLPRAELRDAEKTYHLLGVDGLQQLDAKTPWAAYFEGLGYAKIGADLNVATPAYFEKLGAVVRETDPATLQAYLRWHILHAGAAALGRDLVAADFKFQSALTGARQLSPRWERCVQLANFGLGELVGQAFVQERFAGDSKDVALRMIAAIEQAFEAGLPALGWMDPATRERAVEKLRAIRNKIGYPDKWRDYAKLKVSRKDHFANVVAGRRFHFTRDFDRVGQTVDKAEWHMPPALVNAYYNPSENEMVFPAGILQPPFFSAEYPMALNFGGIGMVMGHELSHGFDDQGRKFDGAGVMREWWDPSAAAKFQGRAQCIDDLYGGIEVLPGVRLDGKLTLGENIADFGGIKAAYAGYRAWLKGQTDKQLVQGLSNEQLFFVGFAQGWCTHETPESQRLRATIDPHSPPKQRVNVPLAHFRGFADAWQCSAGTPMRAAEACELW